MASTTPESLAHELEECWPNMEVFEANVNS